MSEPTSTGESRAENLDSERLPQHGDNIAIPQPTNKTHWKVSQDPATPTPTRRAVETGTVDSHTAADQPSTTNKRKATESPTPDSDHAHDEDRGTLQIKRLCLPQRAAEATIEAWTRFGEAKDTALTTMVTDSVAECRRGLARIHSRTLAPLTPDRRLHLRGFLNNQNLSEQHDLIETGVQELAASLRVARLSIQTMGVKAMEGRIKLAKLMQKIGMPLSSDQENDLDYIMDLFADAEDEASGRA